MQVNVSKFINTLKDKTSDDNFYRALKIAITAIIAFLLFSKTLGTSATFGMILGAAMCSPIDISSSVKDKIMSISLAAILVPIVTIIITLSFGHSVIFYIVFALLIFSISIISLYGQRANQLSFALLLTIAIAFKNFGDTGSAYSSGLYMFCGGMLYLVISIIFYLIKPTKFLNNQVANCILDVSQYLELRAQLWTANPNIQDIKEKQLALQVQINDTFQKTNQYLDFNRMRLVNTKSNQQTILAISFLNDIMDQAVSTTFDRTTLSINLNDNSKEKIHNAIAQLNISFANTLQQLAESIKFFKPYAETNAITDQFQQFKALIASEGTVDTQTEIFFSSITTYLDQQIQKIQSLEHIYSNKFDWSDIKSDDIYKQTTFVPTEYRFQTLIENLNFKSIYFRYALRVTISMILGYILGSFIALQREYWVLLTIIVIMRPGYGLTKVRMNKRVLGTLIGALMSIIILHYITNDYLLGGIVFLSILLGFWYTSIDYKIGVTFITIYILVITGMLSKDADISVFYRVVNTLTGAAIAFVASNLLWPTWEYSSIKTNLTQSLKSTMNYINAFKEQYADKKGSESNLQMSRQNAYIAVGNLMACYQRLIQEPKSKQKNKTELYYIALLNQSTVGAITSLSSFLEINQDKTQPNFDLLKIAIQNIENTITNISNKNNGSKSTNVILSPTLDTNNPKTDSEDYQIIIKQLTWINSLTSKIEEESHNIK